MWNGEPPYCTTPRIHSRSALPGFPPLRVPSVVAVGQGKRRARRPARTGTRRRAMTSLHRTRSAMPPDPATKCRGCVIISDDDALWQAIPRIQPRSLVYDGHRHLPLHLQPQLTELRRQAMLVCTFQQPRPKNPMDRDRTSDDPLRQQVDVTHSSLPFGQSVARLPLKVAVLGGQADSQASQTDGASRARLRRGPAGPGSMGDERRARRGRVVRTAPARRVRPGTAGR